MVFEKYKGWNGINIEPSPVIFEKLKRNRPHSMNLNFALSDRTGMDSFTAVIHPEFGELCTNGSLQHTSEHAKLLKEMNCQQKNYDVQTYDYKEFITVNGIKKIDLFVLDVEGNELKVIETMKNSQVLPDVFCIEFGHLNKDEIIKKLLGWDTF